MNTIALFGNPNTGKTSLFNKLTRSYASVGNWAGVTVEKKVGTLRDRSALLVDLPGAYSLHPLSLDEGVTSRFLIDEPPASLINIVDASQLERNLYLTVQLLEYGCPMVIGLNMIDVARGRGILINEQLLAAELGVPVLPIIARSGQGTRALLQQLTDLPSLHDGAKASFRLDYGSIIEDTALTLAEAIQAALPERAPQYARWVALQLIEGNPVVEQYAYSLLPPEWIRQQLELCSTRLTADHEESKPAEHLRRIRTQWITHLYNLTADHSRSGNRTLTEKVDAVFTHPLFGIPIFLLMMFAIFKLTFDWAGNLLADQIDALIAGPVSSGATSLLQLLGASAFTQGLIVDGIIAGVGGVLVFMPQIAILFLMISLVEDSGYMARITLLMDRMMEYVGLNGKAFIPFIIGFGCNVPAVMAARAIEQRRERLLTILLVPLMSCSARLPVYTLFAGVFFARHQAVVVMILYLLGMVVALGLARLLSNSPLFAREKSFFLVELPPYRVPQPLSLFRNTWEKVKGFLHKAGTIILAGSVAIWLLSHLGMQGYGIDMDHSFLAAIGGVFAPLLDPVGFGTWQAVAALLTGFMAKEVVVSTMNIIYHAPTMEGLGLQLGSAFTALQAFSFMVFVLLYTPCLATVSVIRKETQSWKWAGFSILYAVLIAYVLALLIYQLGRLIGYV